MGGMGEKVPWETPARDGCGSSGIHFVGFDSNHLLEGGGWDGVRGGGG